MLPRLSGVGSLHCPSEAFTSRERKTRSMKLNLFILTVALCSVIGPSSSEAATNNKKLHLSSLASELAFIRRFKPGTTYREVKNGLPAGVTMSRPIWDHQANIAGFIATLHGRVTGQISFMSRSSYQALKSSGADPRLSTSEPIYVVKVRLRDGAVRSKQASKSRISALISLLGKPKTSCYDEWQEGEGGWDVEWTLPDKAVVTYDENPLDATRHGELSVSYFEAYGYH